MCCMYVEPPPVYDEQKCTCERPKERKRNSFGKTSLYSSSLLEYQWTLESKQSRNRGREIPLSTFSLNFLLFLLLFTFFLSSAWCVQATCNPIASQEPCCRIVSCVCAVALARGEGGRASKSSSGYLQQTFCYVVPQLWQFHPQVFDATASLP